MPQINIVCSQTNYYKIFRLCSDTEIWNLICLPMAPGLHSFSLCSIWAQTPQHICLIHFVVMIVTHSNFHSPPSSTGGWIPQQPAALSDTKAKVKWSIEDEQALVHYLLKHKREASNGSGFKQDVWNGAATLMASSPTEGGKKSPNVCKTKWARVHIPYPARTGDC